MQEKPKHHLDGLKTLPAWLAKTAAPRIRERYFTGTSLPVTFDAQDLGPIEDQEVAAAVAYVDYLMATGRVR